MVGVLLLLLASFGTVFYAISEEGYRLSPGIVELIAVLLIGIVVVEWPWRSTRIKAAMAGVRFALLGMTLLWLALRFNTYGWLRVVPQVQVTEYNGRLVESEFMRGAHSMLRLAVYALTDASFAILGLVWLAAIPGIRAAYRLYKDY